MPVKGVVWVVSVAEVGGYDTVARNLPKVIRVKKEIQEEVRLNRT